MQLYKNRRGFTLIELLLYVSITGLLLLSVTIFFSLLFQVRIKNQVIAEVEQQGMQVMQIMTQTIRNAENITAPTQGGSDASLSIDVLTSSSDPTVFALSGGVLQITEGTATPISLTNSRVTVSDLTFQNLSRTSTPGTVRITLTITAVNPSGRNEYNFTKTFVGSATLRQPS